MRLGLSCSGPGGLDSCFDVLAIPGLVFLAESSEWRVHTGVLRRRNNFEPDVSGENTSRKLTHSQMNGQQAGETYPGSPLVAQGLSLPCASLHKKVSGREA